MLRKNGSFLFLIVSLLIVFGGSCTKDNSEEYYNNICDTINVSYASTVRPILDRNCMSCHFAGNPRGVDLETYQDVKTVAEDGRLSGALNHLPGYTAMPLNGKLDDCSIMKIDSWIENGAQND